MQKSSNLTSDALFFCWLKVISMLEIICSLVSSRFTARRSEVQNNMRLDKGDKISQ